MNRQRLVGLVAGVAAVAAAVGVPVLVVANGGDGPSDSTQPVPSPTQTTEEVDWLTTVPEGFPLTDQFPKQNWDGTPVQVGARVAEGIPLCDRALWPADGTIDEKGVSWLGEIEATASRSISVFEDDAAARKAVETIRSALADCPEEDLGNGSATVNQRIDLDLGTEQSLVLFSQAQEKDGTLSGLTVTEVARAGNAVYVTSSYRAGGGDEVLPYETHNLRKYSAAPLGYMCVFAADPCYPPAPPAPSETPTRAPSAALADFPLDLGYPKIHGMDGSPVQVTGRPGVDVIDACGKTVWSAEAQAVDDVIGAEYYGEAEDGRARTLAVYQSEQAAEAAITAALAAVEACPTELTGYEGDAETHLEVRGVELGDQSVAWTARYPGPEGVVSTGMSVYHLVRVGDAVYAARETGEGGGSEESIAAAIEHATEQARPIVEAMREL